MAHSFYTAPLPLDQQFFTITSTGLAQRPPDGPWFRRRGWRWYQLMYTLRGGGLGDIDGQPLRASKDTIWIMPKDRDHGYHQDPSGEGWEYRWIEFDGEACPSLLRMLGLDVRPCADHCAAARPLLEEIVHALETRGDEALHETAAWLFQVLVVMEKCGRAQGERQASRLRLDGRLRSWFHENLARNVGLKDAAQELGLSVEHLIREFRKANGVSPKRFLRDLRINRALGLMHDPALNVSQIGQAIGYPCLAHFSRVFKQATGMSPRQFRRRLGNPLGTSPS